MRESIRRAWGVTDKTKVIVALGNPAGAVDAMAIVTAASFVRESGRDVAIVLGPGANQLHRAWRVLSLLNRGLLLICDDRAQTLNQSFLEACDLALIVSGRGAITVVMDVGLSVLVNDTNEFRDADGKWELTRRVAMGRVASVAREVCRVVDAMGNRKEREVVIGPL